MGRMGERNGKLANEFMDDGGSEGICWQFTDIDLTSLVTIDTYNTLGAASIGDFSETVSTEPSK